MEILKIFPNFKFSVSSSKQEVILVIFISFVLIPSPLSLTNQVRAQIINRSTEQFLFHNDTTQVLSQNSYLQEYIVPLNEARSLIQQNSSSDSESSESNDESDSESWAEKSSRGVRGRNRRLRRIKRLAHKNNQDDFFNLYDLPNEELFEPESTESLTNNDDQENIRKKPNQQVDEILSEIAQPNHVQRLDAKETSTSTPVSKNLKALTSKPKLTDERRKKLGNSTVEGNNGTSLDESPQNSRSKGENSGKDGPNKVEPIKTSRRTNDIISEPKTKEETSDSEGKPSVDRSIANGANLKRSPTPSMLGDFKKRKDLQNSPEKALEEVGMEKLKELFKYNEIDEDETDSSTPLPLETTTSTTTTTEPPTTKPEMILTTTAVRPLPSYIYTRRSMGRKGMHIAPFRTYLDEEVVRAFGSAEGELQGSISVEEDKAHTSFETIEDTTPVSYASFSRSVASNSRRVGDTPRYSTNNFKPNVEGMSRSFQGEDPPSSRSSEETARTDRRTIKETKAPYAKSIEETLLPLTRDLDEALEHPAHGTTHIPFLGSANITNLTAASTTTSTTTESSNKKNATDCVPRLREQSPPGPNPGSRSAGESSPEGNNLEEDVVNHFVEHLGAGGLHADHGAGEKHNDHSTLHLAQALLNSTKMLTEAIKGYTTSLKGTVAPSAISVVEDLNSAGGDIDQNIISGGDNSSSLSKPASVSPGNIFQFSRSLAEEMEVLTKALESKGQTPEGVTSKEASNASSTTAKSTKKKVGKSALMKHKKATSGDSATKKPRTKMPVKKHSRSAKPHGNSTHKNGGNNKHHNKSKSTGSNGKSPTNDSEAVVETTSVASVEWPLHRESPIVQATTDPSTASWSRSFFFQNAGNYKGANETLRFGEATTTPSTITLENDTTVKSESLVEVQPTQNLRDATSSTITGSNDASASDEAITSTSLGPSSLFTTNINSSGNTSKSESGPFSQNVTLPSENGGNRQEKGNISTENASNERDIFEQEKSASNVEMTTEPSTSSSTTPLKPPSVSNNCDTLNESSVTASDLVVVDSKESNNSSLSDESSEESPAPDNVASFSRSVGSVMPGMPGRDFQDFSRPFLRSLGGDGGSLSTQLRIDSPQRTVSTTPESASSFVSVGLAELNSKVAKMTAPKIPNNTLGDSPEHTSSPEDIASYSRSMGVGGLDMFRPGGTGFFTGRLRPGKPEVLSRSSGTGSTKQDGIDSKLVSRNVEGDKSQPGGSVSKFISLADDMEAYAQHLRETGQEQVSSRSLSDDLNPHLINIREGLHSSEHRLRSFFAKRPPPEPDTLRKKPLVVNIKKATGTGMKNPEDVAGIPKKPGSKSKPLPFYNDSDETLPHLAKAKKLGTNPKTPAIDSGSEEINSRLKSSAKFKVKSLDTSQEHKSPKYKSKNSPELDSDSSEEEYKKFVRMVKKNPVSYTNGKFTSAPEIRSLGSYNTRTAAPTKPGRTQAKGIVNDAINRPTNKSPGRRNDMAEDSRAPGSKYSREPKIKQRSMGGEASKSEESSGEILGQSPENCSTKIPAQLSRLNDSITAPKFPNLTNEAKQHDGTPNPSSAKRTIPSNGSEGDDESSEAWLNSKESTMQQRTLGSNPSKYSNEYSEEILGSTGSHSPAAVTSLRPGAHLAQPNNVTTLSAKKQSMEDDESLETWLNSNQPNLNSDLKDSVQQRSLGEKPSKYSDEYSEETLGKKTKTLDYKSDQSGSKLPVGVSPLNPATDSAKPTDSELAEMHAKKQYSPAYRYVDDDDSLETWLNSNDPRSKQLPSGNIRSVGTATEDQESDSLENISGNKPGKYNIKESDKEAKKNEARKLQGINSHAHGGDFNNFGVTSPSIPKPITNMRITDEDDSEGDEHIRL